MVCLQDLNTLYSYLVSPLQFFPSTQMVVSLSQSDEYLIYVPFREFILISFPFVYAIAWYYLR